MAITSFMILIGYMLTSSFTPGPGNQNDDITTTITFNTVLYNFFHIDHLCFQLFEKFE